MKIKIIFSILSLFAIALTNSAFVTPNKQAIPLDKLSVHTNLKVEGKQSFVEFLSLFDKTEMPFKIGLDDFKKYQAATTTSLKKKSKKSASNNDEKLMQKYLSNGKMYISRMGPPQQMPVARFYPNDQTVAVVYASYLSYRVEKDISFSVSLFDLKGNKITAEDPKNLQASNSFLLANTSVFGETQTCHIQTDGYIWKRSYKKIWEKDVKEFGIQNNTVLGHELVDTNVFQISESGLITEAKSYPMMDRASIN